MEWTDTHIIELINQQVNSHGDMNPFNIASEIWQGFLKYSYLWDSNVNILTNSSLFLYPCISEDMKYASPYKALVYQGYFSYPNFMVGTETLDTWSKISLNFVMYGSLAYSGTDMSTMRTVAIPNVMGDTLFTGEQEVVRMQLRRSKMQEAYGGGDFLRDYKCVVFPKFSDFNGCTDVNGNVSLRIEETTLDLGMYKSTKATSSSLIISSYPVTAYKVYFDLKSDFITAFPTNPYTLTFQKDMEYVPKFV